MALSSKAFPNPLVIAYRRNASLRDLLVHSTLPHENSSGQQPAGIKKCNYPRCLTFSFLGEGQTNYTFFTTNEARKNTDSISCHSKNLIYLIECKRCHLQYIGETKRQLSERFGEHRQSILNYQQLSTTTPVSLHLNQAGHSINDVRLIPIELICSKRDSVRKAREVHIINKTRTLHPFAINKRNEARQWHIWHLFNHSLRIVVTYFYLNFYCNGFLFTYFSRSAPEEGLYCKPKYRAILFKII